MRAYLTLHLVPKREDASRDVPVARVGRYEVRLVEATLDGEEVLALELHDNNRGVLLDSVDCEDVAVAQVFAEEMILWAGELQSRSACAGRTISSLSVVLRSE